MPDPARVRVYWNRHRSLWSIASRGEQRLIFHAAQVRLADVTFVVRAAGRNKMLRDGRRNVHAFAVGTLVESGDDLEPLSGPVRQVTYRGHVAAHFLDVDTGEPVTSAAEAFLSAGRVAIPATRVDLAAAAL